MELSLVHFVTATLIAIAFGMGLGLRPTDFRNLAAAPRGVIAGSVGQIILLPTVAAVIASLTGSPVIATGLLLIGVCPGGSSSNYMSYLARGDVALSITLTALSGFLSVVYVPAIFNFAAAHILDKDVSVSLPVVRTMLSILFYLVVPVILGMAVRQAKPDFAAKWRGRVATGAFILLLILTPFLVIDYFDQLLAMAAPIIGWVSLLIVVMMTLGFLLGSSVGLLQGQTRSLTVEIGVQNVALSIFLAVVFLGDVRYVAVPIGYLIMMFVFVPGFIALCRVADRRRAARMSG